MSGESSYYNYMMRQEMAGRAPPLDFDQAFFNFRSAVAAVVDAGLHQPSNYDRSVAALCKAARYVSGEGVRSAIAKVRDGYERAGRPFEERVIVSRVLDAVERKALKYISLASAPVADGSLPYHPDSRQGFFPRQDAFQNPGPFVS